MNVTFSLELNASGTSGIEKKILIRCTQNRKHKRIATGVSVPEDNWDKIRKKVKKSHPMAVELNKLLTEKLKKITAVYSRLLSEKDDVILDDIIADVTGNTQVNFFEFAYRTKMAEFKARKKLGTYKRYETILNKFKEFAGANLTINRVNYELLKRYEIYLVKEKKNTTNTVSSNLSGIRSIISEAKRQELYKKGSPFEQMRLTYVDPKKEKLSAAELHRLFNTPLPNIFSIQLARDFFMACFLAEGTRGGDMVTMQPENIVNNQLVFTQHKSGTNMNIPISKELMDIFKKYQGTGKYIFPLHDKQLWSSILNLNKQFQSSAVPG